MRKHAVVLGLVFLGLAAFATFAGWASFSGSQVEDGHRSLGSPWPYMLGAGAVIVALVGFLLWLAFYANSHRFDDE